MLINTTNNMRQLVSSVFSFFTRHVAAVVLLFLASQAAVGDEPAALEHFENKIRPLLAKHCWKCHGEKKSESGLRLDTAEGIRQGGGSGPVMVPGKPEESLLLRAVRQSGDLKMPPDGKLKPAQIDDLALWIRDGALWPNPNIKPSPHGGSRITDSQRRHWAFQPVRRQPLPKVRNTSWIKSPIDYFVLARLEQKGLQGAPLAEKRILLRRLTFDLTGLPPTPEEMAAFLKDGSADALARAVERLLASPRYGERWGRHWMDVVRYADTAGDNADYPVPEARLYRDYIIDSFNADKPYDQFVREQIAGDVLARQNLKSQISDSGGNFAEQIVATGFLALSRRYATAPYEFMHLTIEDAIDTTGRAFMGLTLRCARCHDHKYDPLTREDYYALYGFFASTRFPYAGSEEFASKNEPRTNFVALLPQQEANRRFDEHHRHMELRRGHIKQEEQALQAAGSDAAKKRQLEERLARLRGDLRGLERWGAPADLPLAYAVTDGKPVDESVHLRGEPDERGPVVPRGVPKFLASDVSLNIPKDESGRLQLAEWLTRPENPLTARVIVNRVWHHHFGRGLVTTPSNFGLRGEPPSHPELLDYLADYFVRHGWSIKALHRLILNSATWQQASDAARSSAADDEALYAHFTRRRLDAEAIRDAMMFLAGTLRLDRSGPHPFPDISTWGWTQHSPFKDVYDSPHRSAYLMRQRIQRHPYLALFDAPDANVTTDVRTSATVPLQALYLLNNPFVHEQAVRLARRLLAAHSTTDDRIRLGCELAWARPPSADEVKRAKEYVAGYAAAAVQSGAPSDRAEQQAWSSYAWILLTANEFFYID
jgi:hypothetical protein